MKRFTAKINYNGPLRPKLGTRCWIWTGSIRDNGYGQFNAYDGANHIVKAHIFAYEASEGNVPVGLELDHLCRNRACVNPAHLEPVTHTENVRRGAAGPRPFCPRGHRKDGVFLLHGKPCAYCLTCNRERARINRR